VNNLLSVAGGELVLDLKGKKKKKASKLPEDASTAGGKDEVRYECSYSLFLDIETPEWFDCATSEFQLFHFRQTRKVPPHRWLNPT
jgi:hypothetical protein